MDIRTYFQKLRALEAEIEPAFVVVISHETPDGGKAGVANEVQRSVAAQLVMDGRARLATSEEAQVFRAEQNAGRAEAEQKQSAARLQVTVISDADLRALRSSSRPKG